jgi:hypothetical protein
MVDPTLAVMAAGIGSRYGGLKQIEPVGPHGEIVVDYSVYDAFRAGFCRIVFLIRRDMQTAFREKIGREVEGRADTIYVFQEPDHLPASFVVPDGRTKPWGTGHAVLSCKDAIHAPFAVINADDFYGAAAFQTLARFLRQAQDRDDMYDYGMVGYALRNTLSEHGHVARGVCQVTPDGLLIDVRERQHIESRPDGIQYTENGADWVTLPSDSSVSMNAWGFTPSILTELGVRFSSFLQANRRRLADAEFFLPDAVGDLIKEGKARVKVLPIEDKWWGVTYREDLPVLQAAIRALIRQGAYPEKLWND